MLISTPLCSHCRSRCRWVQRPIINSSALFVSLIIRTFQFVFSAETVFFSHNKSPGTVFRLVFSAKWTGPMFIKQHNRVVFNKNIAHFLYEAFSFTFSMPNLDITNSFGWLPLRRSTEILQFLFSNCTESFAQLQHYLGEIWFRRL